MFVGCTYYSILEVARYTIADPSLIGPSVYSKWSGPHTDVSEGSVESGHVFATLARGKANIGWPGYLSVGDDLFAATAAC